MRRRGVLRDLRLDVTTLGVDHVTDELRRHVPPAVGDRVVRRPHLDRRHGDRLADRDRADVGAVPVRRLLEHTFLFLRKAEGGVLAEPERLEGVDERIEPTRRLDQLGDLDDADVRRLREDLVHRHHLGGVRVRVVDRLVVERDLVGDLDEGVRGDETHVVRRRDRHELHDRTGLVEADGLVERALHDLPLSRTRHRCHGQDLAGLGAAQHDGAAFGLHRLDLPGELAFGEELQRPVEGEGDVGTGLGRPDDTFGPGNGGAADTLLHQLLALGGAELLVVEQFDARSGRRCVPVHRTGHRPGEVTVDGDALGVLRQREAGDARRLQLLGDVGVDLTGDDGVAGVGLLEGVEHREPFDPEDAGDLGGGRLGIHDERRVDGHQLGRHRHDEGLAVAVEDRAPEFVQGDGALTLAEPERLVGVGVEDADPEDPRREEQGERHDDEIRDGEPDTKSDLGAAATGHPARRARRRPTSRAGPTGGAGRTGGTRAGGAGRARPTGPARTGAGDRGARPGGRGSGGRGSGGRSSGGRGRARAGRTGAR